MATRGSACPCSLSGRLSKRDFSVCSSEVIGGTPTAGPPGRRPNRTARRSPAAVRGRAAARRRTWGRTACLSVRHSIPAPPPRGPSHSHLLPVSHSPPSLPRPPFPAPPPLLPPVSLPFPLPPPF